ncbi:unnamed protein product, partial [Chrysoparadoxa australica]
AGGSSLPQGGRSKAMKRARPVGHARHITSPVFSDVESLSPQGITRPSKLGRSHSWPRPLDVPDDPNLNPKSYLDLDSGVGAKPIPGGEHLLTPPSPGHAARMMQKTADGKTMNPENVSNKQLVNRRVTFAALRSDKLGEDFLRARRPSLLHRIGRVVKNKV